MSGSSSSTPAPKGQVDDADLRTAERWWLTRPSAARRIGDVIRRAFDEVLDGQRTGRFIYEDLKNTEKTYVGTKVEILLAEEFDLPPGPGPKHLDFGIEGIGVDCKYSQDTSWMIPVEAVDELCLLISASDATSTFNFGILRCNMQHLGAENRDRKRSVLVAGRQAARWLWQNEPMPENLLRRLSEADRQAIFSPKGRGSGQERVNELFRRVHDRIVRREVTLTVARQADSMKRARDARIHLQPEGVIVLGHQNQHPRIADELGIPVPRKGEFVATRVVRATLPRQMFDRESTLINSELWLKAVPADPTEPGPLGPY